jgi:hypothetical protein
MKVIATTLLRSLNIEPRYDGNKTEIQHGAKSAAIPAIKAVISDARIKILTLIDDYRQNF